MDLADIQAFSKRGAELGSTLWAATVLLAGEEYAATVPDPRVSADLEVGQTFAGLLVVRISTTLIEEKPAADQALQWKRPTEADWRSPKWWVDTVTKSPLDSEWVLSCSPKN